MQKGEMITREEAEKTCSEVAKNLRHGVLNEIQVLKKRLFDEIADGVELQPIWVMAGDYLGHIIGHAEDAIEDIEAGRYLPKGKEVQP